MNLNFIINAESDFHYPKLNFISVLLQMQFSTQKDSGNLLIKRTIV